MSWNMQLIDPGITDVIKRAEVEYSLKSFLKGIKSSKNRFSVSANSLNFYPSKM